jgi:CelD/BcsL family acetyltransferase involved in cellulose biosynthesis
MLSELESLHQKHWSMRGKLGSFSSEKFRNFHKELIHRMFPMGAIQILQVQAGSSTIGILYNFVYAGKVYHYQSGFNYTDKRLSPGLVTISCAVQYCLDLGLDEFDFLAGDYQYKRVLGVNYRDLVWTVFRRTNLKMRTLDFMREAKRRWVNRRRKET